MKTFLSACCLLFFLPLSAQYKHTKLVQAEQLLLTSPVNALRIVNEVSKTSLKKNDYYNASLACSLAAAVYRKDGDCRTLLQYDSLAVVYANKGGHNQLVAQACINAANDLASISNTDGASKYLDKSAALAGDINTTLYYQWHIAKANTAFKIFKMDTALAHYKQALSGAEVMGSATAINLASMLIGEAVLYKGKADSLHLVYTALEYFDAQKDADNAHKAAMTIGFAFQTSFKLDKAMAYYTRAINYALKIKDQRKATIATQRLGDVLLTQKNHSEAIKLFETCHIFFEKNHYQASLAIAKIYLGRAYTETGEVDYATRLFDGADSINKIIKLSSISFAVSGYRMLLAAKMKNFKAADSLSARATQLGSALLDKDLQKMATNKLQEGNGPHVQRQPYNPYKNTLLPASTMAKITPAEYYKMDSLNVYTGKNMQQDSSVLAIAAMQINELETKYKTKIITDSFRIQQQQSVMAKEQVRNRNNIIITVGFALLLLSGGFYLQYKSRQRAVRDKNHIELLQHEIHHRVKNNLAVINRLVEVAGKNATDAVPLSALQHRIKTIELLHQHLYSATARPGNISLQPYLQQLCLAITTTFDTGKNIQISVDASIEVEGGVAEKLGLIINELVTNSYKYAFTNKLHGHITIEARQSAAQQIELIVKDDGDGFDSNSCKGNYGIKLIKGLSVQLNGQYTFEKNGGTVYRLVIPSQS